MPEFDVQEFQPVFGIDGDVVVFSISAACAKADREAADREAWIAEVSLKLRDALAYAAIGEDFDWDELGSGDWPDPAPQAYVFEPNPSMTWDETHPDWPEPPDADAPYHEQKRYLNVRFWADDYLQLDQDLKLPEELRLSHAQAWALAAQAYDSIHSPDPDAGT